MLSGPLEPTNRPYAVAKIAGIEMCWSYNRQYGTRYLAAMPTNLYGPGDNYDLNTSHVIPALIRKIAEAHEHGDSPVTLWGTGTPRREFLYSEDMAEACLFLINLPDEQFVPIASNEHEPPLVNVGWGEDVSVRELAAMIADIVGFKGTIGLDTSKPDGTPQKLLDVSAVEAPGLATFGIAAPGPGSSLQGIPQRARSSLTSLSCAQDSLAVPVLQVKTSV